MTYEPTPGSTVVVVMYPSTTAAAGQTGVVQVISSGGRKRWSGGVWVGSVMAVAGVVGMVSL